MIVIVVVVACTSGVNVFGESLFFYKRRIVAIIYDLWNENIEFC